MGVSWVAIANGALDVADTGFSTDAEILVLPVVPTVPLVLPKVGAQLWRRLVAGPIGDADLDADEYEVVREMAAAGLASDDPQHPSRVSSISKPWLSSPLQELTYALVAKVCQEDGIDAVFVKGPVLHQQGLRLRRDSIDLDVWVDPKKVDHLAAALAPWGWVVLPDVWGHADINHSITLGPTNGWSCQVDVHRRMPGLGKPDAAAFAALLTHSTVRSYAGVDARVPTREMHAVIAAVHHLRPEIGVPIYEQSRADAAYALNAVGSSTIAAAAQIDATRALASTLHCLFPDQLIDSDSAGVPRDWEWRAQPNKVRAYVVALKELPIWRRPAAFVRLVWPTRAVAELSNEWAGQTRANASSSRLRRIRRGLSQVLRKRS